MNSCGPHASVYLLSTVIDFPPHLVNKALSALKGVCEYIYVHQCLVTWFAQISCYLVATDGGYLHDSRSYFRDPESFFSFLFEAIAVAPDLQTIAYFRF